MPLSLADLAAIPLSPSDKGLPARAAGLSTDAFLATAPRLGEFWTPLLVLDREGMLRNARTIQAWCTARGFELMPHGKTTMAPALWRLQLDEGASGLTLATPGQVRTARAFGVDRIMLANAIVAPAALAWLAGELDDPALRFCSWVDEVETVEAMERGLAGLALARPVEVLVELGAPGGRTGARSVDDAVRLARRVADSPVMRLAGVAGYEGSLGHDRSPAALDAVRGYLARMLELRAAIGDLVDGEAIVTAGGSAYLDLVAEVFGPAAAADDAASRRTRWIVRSGASLLHDHGFYRGISPLDGSAAEASQALVPAMRALSRVVSHPEPGLALLDGGKRDLPFDEGLPVPLGLEGARITALNDQHAYLRADEPAAALPVSIGDVVELGLSHPCTAFDKWRVIPVVEHSRSDLVVDLVRTVF
ncbi:alanine racemase [Agromyces soli]